MNPPSIPAWNAGSSVPSRNRSQLSWEWWVANTARTSNEVVDGLGVAYTWQHSYVAGDKIYCVHETDEADTVREHAQRGGFPANVVVKVAAVFGPQTASS